MIYNYNMRNSFLLTWDPKIFPWDEINDDIEYLRENDVITDFRWDCYRDGACPGDLFYIYAVGNKVKKRGIFCSGIITEFFLNQKPLIPGFKLEVQ